ncbi:bcl-2-like protein 2 [Watersipora subatra]|uniref:bcl-2-like protein 2 n=1 Tax=Watersipora subatra TaxID=2589382 RepID=UPI00355C0D1F
MVCEVTERLTEMETEDIVTDYTAYKLRLSGYDNWRPSTELPTPAMRTMRTLGQQFEDSYTTTFEDMTRDIDVTGPEAQDSISNISSVLFSDGIRWGRVVGLIVFSAKLSVKAMEANLPDQVNNIVSWTTSHLKLPRFRLWLEQNNKWEGFVKFYERPENQNPRVEEFSWTRMCSLGIATIAGAAAAIHLFVQKS